MALTRDQASIVKGMLLRGDKQQDIAAFFSVNSARIAEVKKGQLFPDVDPAPGRQLPSPEVVAHGFAAWVAQKALDDIDRIMRAARARITAHVGGTA